MSTKATASGDDTEQPTPSYEQARAELAEVVAELESGGAGLAEAMKLWERGEALATACELMLDDAAARIAAVRPPGAETEDEP